MYRKPNWGRITGRDVSRGKGMKIPVQQGTAFKVASPKVVLYPYGMSCDLPDDVLFLEIMPGVVMPVTQTRPTGNRGDMKLFHPDNLKGGVTVTGSNITLGDGGAAIGRVGDEVEVPINQEGDEVVTSVTGGSGSPAVGVFAPTVLKGTITEGGVNFSI